MDRIAGAAAGAGISPEIWTQQLTDVEKEELLEQALESVAASGEESTNFLLTNPSIQSINEMISRVLRSAAAGAEETTVAAMERKLWGEYRYVDEIRQLRRGLAVRWVRLSSGGGVVGAAAPAKLTAGGIVLDIVPAESGNMNVVCRLISGQICRYNFNETLTFQKLTPAEKVILAMKEYFIL
jgi:hypothetical protein